MGSDYTCKPQWCTVFVGEKSAKSLIFSLKFASMRDLRSQLADRVFVSMSEPVYRIQFHNQDKVYEMYARHIYSSDLYGFIEVEAFIFGERSELIVDPSEDRLKTEFTGVKRSFIPMHSVIRIDEVEKEGQVKISDGLASNISAFPLSAPPPNSNK